jgi:hypothetical protein
MRTIGRFRPTPSMVIASLALLLALTGTGVAAIQLAPKNSIASPQVVDGSLQKKDLNASVFAGAVGPPGPAGPSDAFAAVTGDATITLSENAFTPVASLRIPKAGKYVVWARTLGRASAEDVISCKLEGGGTSERVWTYLNRVANGTLTAIIVGELPAGNVTFGCNSTTGKATARNTLITAIKVANLTTSG